MSIIAFLLHIIFVILFHLLFFLLFFTTRHFWLCKNSATEFSMAKSCQRATHMFNYYYVRAHSVTDIWFVGNKNLLFLFCIPAKVILSNFLRCTTTNERRKWIRRIFFTTHRIHTIFFFRFRQKFFGFAAAYARDYCDYREFNSPIN